MTAATAVISPVQGLAPPRPLGLGTPSRPPKPRLLWRGSLLLPDGTALPGVAFVSHSHPLASGAVAQSSPEARRPFAPAGAVTREVHRPATIDDDGEDEAEVSTTLIEDPAIEADLCLALEMVRHRPLRIVSTERDNRRTDAVTPKAKMKPAAASADSQKIVRWEHSVGMRMYIDPAEEETLDYFTRKFCLEEEQSCPGPLQHAPNIVLVSLEPSQALASPTHSRSSSSDGQVSSGFSLWVHGGSSSSSAQELAIFAASRCADHAHALDLVLGRRVITKRSSAAARKRAAAAAAAGGVGLGFGLDLTNGLNRDPFAARPDDPMPRTNAFITKLQARPRAPIARVPSRSHADFAVPKQPASANSGDLARSGSLQRSVSSADVKLRPGPRANTAGADAEGQAQSQAATSGSGGSGSGLRARSRLARNPSAPPGGDPNPKAGKAKKGNTPGRRGEKRPVKLAPGADGASDLAFASSDVIEAPSPPASPSLKRSAEGLPQLPPPDVKRARPEREASATPGPDSPPASTFASALLTSEPLELGAEPSRSGAAGKAADEGTGVSAAGSAAAALEQKNRGVIKKLVHHQLLGRGYEKGDAAYGACYGAACAGTAVALRHVLARKALDRAKAAGIVRTHLDLYLADEHDAPLSDAEQSAGAQPANEAPRAVKREPALAEAEL